MDRATKGQLRPGAAKLTFAAVASSALLAALVSTDGRYFVMVLVDQLSRQSKGSGEAAMVVIRYGPSLPSSDLRRSFCHAFKEVLLAVAFVYIRRILMKLLS